MKSKKPDGAQKIAEKEYHDIESPGVYDECDKRCFRRLRNALATRIRRLVAREVKRERERCIDIIKMHTTESPYTDSKIVAHYIVRGIKKGTP